MLSDASGTSNMEVDYLVLGGGSAGCVVASRLSEDPDAAVALFEVGARNDSLLVNWPAGYSKLQGENYRWEWMTVPQKHLGDRPMLFPQGKILGGGSSVNSMVYIRGNRRDYDHWAQLGNDGWSYDEVLPYFKRSEDNERFCDDYHGIDGLLGVADQRYPIDLTRRFVRAAQEAGFPFSPDFNGSNQYGAGFYQVTQRNVRRSSSAIAFLYPALRRKNLIVATKARATRILMEGGRAVGATILRNGSTRTETIRARREVIVSCGAINSPKLLLLSGIGPADELRQRGVMPVLDLPGVGKNLQDHMDVYCCASLNKPLSYNGHDSGIKMIRHGIEFLMFGTGAVSSNVCEGGAFVSTTGDNDWPDIQMHFLPAFVIDHGRVKVGGHGMTLNTAYLRPESRGQVTLEPFRVRWNQHSARNGVGAHRCAPVSQRASRQTGAQPCAPTFQPPVSI